MTETDSTTYKELDLLDIYRIIISGKKRIIQITSVSVLLSIIYSFIATEYFQSKITLYPVGESNQTGLMLGNLQGLAETFGFSGLNSKSTYYIPDIIQSRQLKKNIIQQLWKTKNHPEGINLIKFWELDDTSGFSLSKLFKTKDNIKLRLRQTEEAIEKLDKLITVHEEESGLISVSVLAEESGLAADITNYISEYIVKFITERQIYHAAENRIFIEERLKQSKIYLNTDEELLTEFRKKYPLALDTPELQQSRARLIRNIEVNQQVYITLRQQLEIAKIEELKNRILLEILDKADPAVEIAKPKRTRIIFISFCLSLIFSIYVVYFRFRWQSSTSSYNN